MSFSSSDAKLDIKDEDSEGSQMRINGNVYTGRSEDIQCLYALLAPFNL